MRTLAKQPFRDALQRRDVPQTPVSRKDVTILVHQIQQKVRNTRPGRGGAGELFKVRQGATPQAVVNGAIFGEQLDAIEHRVFAKGQTGGSDGDQTVATGEALQAGDHGEGGLGIEVGGGAVEEEHVLAGDDFGGEEDDAALPDRQVAWGGGVEWDGVDVRAGEDVDDECVGRGWWFER